MGIFNRLKNTLDKVLAKSNEEFDKIINDSVRLYENKTSYFYGAKVNDLDPYLNIVSKYSDKEKIDFVVYCIEYIYLDTDHENRYQLTDSAYKRNSIRHAYINQVFKSKLNVDDTDVERISHAIYTNVKHTLFTFKDWNLNYLLNQVENQYKEKELSQKMSDALIFLKDKIALNKNAYIEKDRIKITEKIEGLLFKSSDNNEVKPILFLGVDDFSPFANETILSKPYEEQKLWFALIDKAQKASGSKPSNKYLEESKKIIDELGTDKFRKTIHGWFTFLIALKEKATENIYTYPSGQTSVYVSTEYLSALNVETIKGFVWMSSHFYDSQTIQLLSKLAERSFKKIPQKGPATAAVGNACLFALYNSKGLDGIGQLSRLRLKIKQNNTVNLIEKYINEAAQKLGVTYDEIEDLAVDDFGLKEGKREYDFETIKCTLEITGTGKSDLRWFKADGAEQKTVPALIKEKFAAKLKKIKDTQKQIDQTTTSQRDRIDRMLRGNRLMTLEYFKEKYLNHGLLSFLAKKIIFNFIKNETTVQAIYVNGSWRNFNNEIINIEDYEQVSLWHPVTSDTLEVKKWREYLIENQVLQPLKQAFREIYLLTEAEINTRVYSNRMAAHVLKQHQYVTLAKGRNWSAKLIGSWDGGYEDTATLNLPEYKLRAEYWVNALSADDAYNDSGIWNYVTTDQIRFVNSETNEVVELINVPPVPFSEALRDVDLFVGVASVGNDPTWQDSGGLPGYRDYWQSYSFGDLSEVAKNRKEILKSLIPRLKIAKVAAVEDKFVIVKGKLRTYKIHIGSTNILMEPNDQYLCIVADRSIKNQTENLYLPFEGDNGLSVILSKAFLLAEDDKITDSTITSQVNRK